MCIRDRYYTPDGISRGFKVYYREIDTAQVNAADYYLNSYGVQVSYGFPLNEFDTLRLSPGYEHLWIGTNSGTPVEILVDIAENGDVYDEFKLDASWAREMCIRDRIITLGVLITVHEFGHFWVARRLGVKVLQFSIGFGKPLWKRLGKDGVEYIIAALPLGGYVKMLDEREGEVSPADLPLAFNRQPIGSRIAIVAAGPLCNFLFAILAYSAMFMMGVPGIKPLLDEPKPGSLAAAGGFEKGDLVIAIDGKPTPTLSAVMLELVDRAMAGEIIQVDVQDLSLIHI